MRRIESPGALDRLGPALDMPARVLRRRGRLWSVLRGEPIGHALHPLMTDIPLGMWMSATCLDLAGGRRARPAATGLLAFGLAAAVPTAASGLAEWHATSDGARRAGIAHAVLNGSATVLYGASLAARLTGSHRAGVALALAGGTVATAGGYVGGHLSLVHGVGTTDPPQEHATPPG